MSKFKVGTLVMTKAAAPLAQLRGLRVGHVGVAVALPQKYVDVVDTGNICVDFPGTDTGWCGFWQCIPNTLVPISGPDIAVEDNAERSYSYGDFIRVGEKA